MTEYVCTYCQKGITNIRIKCEECPNFVLCLECFTSGVESGTHKNNHGYILVDDGFSSLFSTNDSLEWSAKQELALIQGVEQYGYGNWETISCHIENKSVDDVRTHFDRHYLSGALGRLTAPTNRHLKVVEHTGPVEGPLSPTLTAPLPPVELTRAEALELGYLPQRDDFEREWDNEAEQVLAGVMVHHTDDDVDSAYKLALVSMYRLRLRERNRRKRVAREFNLVNAYTSSFKKGQPGAKKKSVRDYKEFQDKMKKFAQFLSLHDHDKFFESLQKEKELKIRIKELMKCRRYGIATYEESANFDRDAAKREKNRETRRKMASKLAASARSAAAAASAPSSPNITCVHHTNKKPASPTPTPMEKRSCTVTKQEPEIHENPTPKSLPVKLLPKMPTLQREMLSENERKLCKKIGMKTTSYVTLKTNILKDYVKRQHGMPVKMRFPTGFDKTHRRTILTFLEHSGWIQAG